MTPLLPVPEESLNNIPRDILTDTTILSGLAMDTKY